jgi:Family of unknown function (DUF6221)
MSDLIAFLRARLDEEEAEARALDDLRPGPWTLDADSIGVLDLNSAPRRGTKGFDFLIIGDVPAWSNIGPYLVRWHSGRVLAEVAAKRAILDMLDAAVWRDAQPMLLLALVQPWAEHPDFDPAWRVATL